MKRNENEVCGRCKWWSGKGNPEVSLGSLDGGPEEIARFGECRSKAPTPGDFARTRDNCWCREWEWDGEGER